MNSGEKKDGHVSSESQPQALKTGVTHANAVKSEPLSVPFQLQD